MKIGYIGLGAMGSALAGRLLGAHSLSVWDLNPSASQAIAKRGAHIAASPKDVAQRSDIVLLCLPRSNDVRRVIFGPQGLMEGLNPGSMIIDQTSGTPAESGAIATELHNQGIDFIDAPVSGSPVLFMDGRGTIMVSGPDAPCKRAVPVLAQISDKIMICGQRVGDAQAMKLVNNTINSGCRLAMLELVALGRKLGFSLLEMLEILDVGEARSGPTQLMLPALIAGKPATNFGLALMVKDLHQATTMGRQYGAPMPVAGTSLGLLQAGLSLIGKDARLDDVVSLIEMLTVSRITSVCRDEFAGTPPADTAASLYGSLAACNAVVTWETFAMGLRHGLSMNTMVTVIGASSGGNGVIERMRGWVKGDAVGQSLAASLADLQQVAALAAGLAMPMLMVNAVRGAYESVSDPAHAQRKDLDVARFIGENAGVSLI